MKVYKFRFSYNKDPDDKAIKIRYPSPIVLEYNNLKTPEKLEHEIDLDNLKTEIIIIADDIINLKDLKVKAQGKNPIKLGIWYDKVPGKDYSISLISYEEVKDDKSSDDKKEDKKSDSSNVENNKFILIAFSVIFLIVIALLLLKWQR